MVGIRGVTWAVAVFVLSIMCSGEDKMDSKISLLCPLP